MAKYKIVKYLYNYQSELVSDAILLYESDNDEALLYVSPKYNNKYLTDGFDFICRGSRLDFFKDQTYWSGDCSGYAIHKVKSQKDLQNILKVFDIQKEFNIIEARRIFQ